MHIQQNSQKLRQLSVQANGRLTYSASDDLTSFITFLNR